MDVSTSRRIVLLGKTGVGKSSLANTIMGEDVFKINHLPISETSLSHSVTRQVNGKSITLIDTCSVFDTCVSEKLLKDEIVKCITECAPGPHAFLIVLKVEKFTLQEQEVIQKICQYFSEDAMKYAAVVFTHGDQLPEEMRIEEFISQNKELSNLVKKCGGRCHVVDNKYWKNNQGGDYRCNRFQVAELLRTTEKITEANNGSCYTNEMLQKIKHEIQIAEEHIRQSSVNMSHEDIRNRAVIGVKDKLLIIFAGTATGVLVGALLGVARMVASTAKNLDGLSGLRTLTSTTSGRATLGMAAQRGLLKGGQLGYAAAEGAETPQEAMEKAMRAVWEDC